MTRPKKTLQVLNDNPGFSLQVSSVNPGIMLQARLQIY